VSWSTIVYVRLSDDDTDVRLTDDDETTVLTDDGIAASEFSGTWTPQAAASDTWTPEDAL
jgi:hypothetical protein